MGPVSRRIFLKALGVAAVIPFVPTVVTSWLRDTAYRGITYLINAKGSRDLPVGYLVAFTGETIPDGWLLCDGATVSRERYPELFAVIGTMYWAGRWNGRFRVPDLTNYHPNRYGRH